MASADSRTPQSPTRHDRRVRQVVGFPLERGQILDPRRDTECIDLQDGLGGLEAGNVAETFDEEVGRHPHADDAGRGHIVAVSRLQALRDHLAPRERAQFLVRQAQRPPQKSVRLPRVDDERCGDKEHRQSRSPDGLSTR
jgi:hypothetical protein